MRYSVAGLERSCSPIVHMIRHQMPFDYFRLLVLRQFPENPAQMLP